MSVLDKLATSLGHRDEQPNVALAEQLATSKDKKGVEELVAALKHKNKSIIADALKTLYEVGYRSPELIAPYAQEFIELLKSKNNRLQWGAMTALSSIAPLKQEMLYDAIPLLAPIVDKGTVITRDHYVKILVAIAESSKYNEDAVDLLLEILQTAPENQFPKYAEEVSTVAKGRNRDLLKTIVTDRFQGIEVETKKKRVEKLLKKLNK